MNKVKAVIYQDVDKPTIGEVELLPCGDDQLEAETLYTFVSPGTELRYLAGYYGAEGHFPFVPGYTGISRVTKIGKNVKGFKVGDLISGRNAAGFKDINVMWGGQAAAHTYNTNTEDRPVLLPQIDYDPLPYVVAEMAAISLRGVEAANPQPGETAVVIGQGLIGQFSAEFLMMRGCRTVVGDIDQARLEQARRNGVSEVVDLGDGNAVERLKMIGNGGFDIVVESSGSIPGVQTAFQLVRRKPQNYSSEFKVEPIRFYHNDWPRLVMQANYIKEISINPFGFFPGEGVIVLNPFDRGIEERQMVVEYIRKGLFNPRKFIEQIVTPDEMPNAYRNLQSKKWFSVTCKWK